MIQRDSIGQVGTLLTDMLTLDAPPGSYQLTVKAENVGANRVSLFRQMVEVESYGVSGIQISNPVLAAEIRETDQESVFRRGDLHVMPLPTRLFLEGQALGLYFEVYHLTADKFGQMRYRVTLQITALEEKEGLRQLLTGKEVNPEIAMAFEQVGDQRDVQVYQLIDLNNAKKGQNRLWVIVEDLNSEQSMKKEITFRYGQ